MSLNYRLKVWPAVGAATPRIIARDNSFILGSGGQGLRMKVTPEGECTDAVFAARGSGIQLPPLSAVQLEYLSDTTWSPIWYGEVREGGNTRDVNGEDYNLWGMSRRFEEVTLSPGFSTPLQPAHLTVRAILQDIITSGQLGTPPLVTYDEALIPDLGFNCRAIVNAFQQNPAGILKLIATDGAQNGKAIRWGVRPDRKFFYHPAKTASRNLTSEQKHVTWKAPVSVAPCTAVLWYIAQRPDRTWITHLSFSPDVNTFGLRVKPLTLDTSVPAWKPVPLTYRIRMHGLGGGAYEVAATQPTFNTSAFTDGNLFRDSPSQTIRYDGAGGLLLEAFGVGARRIVYAGESTQRGTYAGVKPIDSTVLIASADDNFSADWVSKTQYVDEGKAVFLGNSSYSSSDTYQQLRIVEIRGEGIDTDLLDGLAAYHFNSPAQEPADIQTFGFVPFEQLPGRIRLEDQSPAFDQVLAAAEYRITADQGFTMGWLAGQADDPAALAQAALIRRRDGEAVITAVTAQT